MVEFAVAILATLPSASTFTLKVSASELLGTKSSDPAEARVMMHDLLSEISAEDLNIVSKTIIAAYDPAFSATDYACTAVETKTFTALETKTSVSFPEKAGFPPSFWSGCRWYPNDDALTDSYEVTRRTTSPFEVVADIKMPNDDDTALMITDTAMAFARFTQSFLPGYCGAIALDDSPIPKDTQIALKHQGSGISRISASPPFPTSTNAPSAASTAPTEILRKPRSRVHSGWGLRKVHCAHGR
jgi:hypothetical protein